MQYRRLGAAGLKLSVISYGSWVSFKNQLGVEHAAQLMKAAYDAGVNFFDNAEGYAAGASEEIMGQVFRQMGWPRVSYVVSTKFYWGLKRGVNDNNTLNRKYLMQAIDGSLKRFGLDYVDLVFCHRPDPDTPLEETVRAMSDMITQGKALYWGTSEWSAEQISAAWHIAERHHLHKPQMEQPQYNMLHRDRVEKEYAALYKDLGLGTTIWSPLAGGLLTGKYNRGIPPGTRVDLPGYEWLRARFTDQSLLDKVMRLQSVADGLGCLMSQLALAWCIKNPNVSTAINGATTLAQLNENMQALALLPQLTDEVMNEINAALG
ncbi:MAG: aldo/keto reductase [Anaerolineae bacterium]|nr:aldo/keto reductase [Anaerolineae bacterium]